MKNLQIRVTTDITTEPVTVAEAKNYCKVTGSQDDSLITLLITSARKALEKYTQSTFAHKHISATWVVMPEDWVIELPYGPHSAVSKVYRIDDQGTETELTVNTDYTLYGDQDFILMVSQYWSTGYIAQSVRVEYTAGYGETATEPLPDELKECILMYVNKSYTYRGDGGEVMDNEIKRKANPYRKKVWF